MMETINFKEIDLIINSFCDKKIDRDEFVRKINEFVIEEVYDIKLDEEIFEDFKGVNENEKRKTKQ